MISDNVYYSLFIGLLYMLLISSLIYIFIKKAGIQQKHISIKLNIKNLIIGFFYSLLYLSVTIAIIHFFDKIEFDTTNQNFIVVFFEKIIGATFEEIIFRLLFIAIIFKHSNNIYLAVLTSSFLFAIMHVFGDIGNALLLFSYLFTTGLLLSFIYLRYSIYVAILFHLTFNIGMEIIEPIHEMGIDIEIIKQNILYNQLYYGNILNLILLIFVLLFDKRIPEIHSTKKIN